MRPIRIGAYILALAAILAPVLVWAEETAKEGIGISPTTVFVTVDAGQTKTGNITVTNEGAGPVDVRLYASNFKVRNEDYDKVFELPASAGRVSPANWFTMGASTTSLAVGEQKKIAYTLKVPASAAAGGYYGALFAETKAAKPDATGVVRIKRVGALAYITVNGELKKGGKIESFKVNRWQQQPPVQSELRVSNSGNVHFEVDGKLRLRNLFGGKVSEAPIKGVVIPETTRRFKLELATGQKIGLYRVEGELSYLDRQEVLGPKWVLLASPLWLGLLLGALGVMMWITFSGRSQSVAKANKAVPKKSSKK